MGPLSRAWAFLIGVWRIVARAWTAGPTLKNTVWIAGSLFVAWVFVGSPSVSHMEQAWQTVATAMKSPETVAQIAESGAAVAVRDVPYVAARIVNTGRGRHMKPKLEQYKGVFRAGQHVCANVYFYDNEEKFSVELPGDYLVTLTNTPGNFRPDTSQNGCLKIPSTRAVPDANGSVLQARKRLAETVRTSDIGAKSFFAFYALVLSFAFWVRSYHYRRGTPADVESLRQRFAGFAVRERDFEQGWRGLYRVNSDRFHVNLENWSFNEGSGEFFLIKERMGKRLIVDAIPFEERFIKHAKKLEWKMKIGGITVLAAFISGAVGYLALSRCDDPSQFWYLGLVTAGLCLFAVVRAIEVISDWHLREAGPEPLPRAVGEFKTQQPHGFFTGEGTI